MSQQINLANPLFMQRRHVLRLREMSVTVALVALAGLTWGWVQLDHAHTLEAQASAQEARLADAQKALAAQQAAATRPPSALLAGRVEATRVEVARREALLKMLGDNQAEPAAGFVPRLRALSASHVEGVWLNGFELAPGAVVLRGSAQRVGLLTTYIDRLGRQPAFAGLRFTALQVGRPSPGATAEGDLPAVIDQVDFELVAGYSASMERGDGH